jgi:hypothetical protein
MAEMSQSAKNPIVLDDEDDADDDVVIQVRRRPIVDTEILTNPPLDLHVEDSSILSQDANTQHDLPQGTADDTAENYFDTI